MNTFKIHSNGRLRSIVTPDGQGGLFYDWIAMTRGRSVAAPEGSGPMLYLRTENGPFAIRGDGETDGIRVLTDVGVPADLDAEIRKITITNNASVTRKIEVTTYAEISLNHPMGDAGHPAFSKLFVQTAVEGAQSILLARRRPRGTNENWPWLAQALISEGDSVTWETNRATFLGRGRTCADPIAMDAPGPLPGGTGNVLDPVMAFRTELSLTLGETQTLWLVTAVAPDKQAVVSVLEKNLTPTTLQALLDSSRRDGNPKLDTIAATMMLGRSDRSIPDCMDGADIVHRYPLAPEEFRVIAPDGFQNHDTQELIAALPYWRTLGLNVRLFIMDGAATSDLPDGVTIVAPSSLTPNQLNWWLASAQWVAGGVVTLPAKAVSPPRLVIPDAKPNLAGTLTHENGYGGFSQDGKEYVIPLPLENSRLKLPPMPWVNVLANPNFGCIVSERGAGYTWSRNSQANRLTAWSNDPMRDTHSEALYLRDAATGDVWSPLPGPCPARSPFIVRHGFGRTRFISETSGISQTVEFLVPAADPLKLVCIRLRNDGPSDRHLTFASYQALVMCSIPDHHHATLAWTDDCGIQHAINPRAGDFAGGRSVAFTKLLGVKKSAAVAINSTAIFLGDTGIQNPASLTSDKFQATRGFGLDACFSETFTFEIPMGAEVQIIVALGETMSEAEEANLIAKYSSPGSYEAAAAESDVHWEKILTHIQIRTPLPEIDLMVNGWLLYQNLACRIWGRSAFYQSGGAYGFRDQLQDSGAFAALQPDLMRSQILLHTAQQFPEGDVTHWWHPEPMGRGMRTKFADDLLWLPYLTDHYLQVTGDSSVLDESLPFIEGPLLGDHEDEEYMKPAVSEKSASVFEHCCLAIDKSLATGKHGLPLMGIGDWNDGMSRIGREGRGESVWMGFFLITILDRWIPLCQSRGETARAATYFTHRDNLLTASNAAGWDGEWYRRAYYDDGTPLGTHSDTECRIDVLAQAWAIISGAASEERAKLALDSASQHLIDEEIGLVRLLHPPFVNTPKDPGYIKGYVAGVRENGGQYTHAACWVVRAMAEAGRRDQAANILKQLSPVWHARDEEAVKIYQVEPYVVAADIYGADPHIGRGGWTWYTGSAGWMFRVAVESVLGLRVENSDTLVLDPRIPNDWPGFEIRYRTPSGKTSYRVEVTNPTGDASGVQSVALDRKLIKVTDSIARWPLTDDGMEHVVMVVLGPA